MSRKPEATSLNFVEQVWKENIHQNLSEHMKYPKIHKHIKHKLNYCIKLYIFRYLRYANSTWTPTSIHSINPPIFSMILLSLRPCLLSLTLLGLEDMAMWSLTLARSRPTWRACVLDEFLHEWLKHHIFFEGHVFHVMYMILYVYMYLYFYIHFCWYMHVWYIIGICASLFPSYTHIYSLCMIYTFHLSQTPYFGSKSPVRKLP